MLITTSDPDLPDCDDSEECKCEICNPVIDPKPTEIENDSCLD